MTRSSLYKEVFFTAIDKENVRKSLFILIDLFLNKENIVEAMRVLRGQSVKTHPFMLMKIVAHVFSLLVEENHFAKFRIKKKKKP